MNREDKEKVKVITLTKGIYWVGDPKKLKIENDSDENRQMKIFDVGAKTATFHNIQMKYDTPVEVEHTGFIGLFNINVVEKKKDTKAGTLFWAIDDFTGTFMTGDPLEVYEFEGIIYIGTKFELRLT